MKPNGQADQLRLDAQGLARELLRGRLEEGAKPTAQLALQVQKTANERIQTLKEAQETYRINKVPPVEVDKMRRQICEIGVRLWQRGMCSANDGNISIRVGADRYLCTPTGVSKGFMKPEQMCIVDSKGKHISGGKPTSEVQMHLAIYRWRPDVTAVVHTHAPHATAFAVSGVDLPTGLMPEAEFFLGAVATARYATPGDQRLAFTVLPHIEHGHALLLQNHGAVTFHTDIEQAWFVMEVLDQYARMALMLRQLGSARPITSHEQGEVVALKERLGLSHAAERPYSAACDSFLQELSLGQSAKDHTAAIERLMMQIGLTL